MIWFTPNYNLVPVIPEIWCEKNKCHWNVDTQIDLIGGEKITGCYLVYSKILKDFQLIRHSIWKFGDEIIDITPYGDNRNKICFLNYDIKYKNLFGSEINVINKHNLLNKESVMSYYVYGLVDPKYNKVFYIGKGTGKRAESHFDSKTIEKYLNRPDKKIHDRKMDKIISILNKNMTPDVIYYAENIESSKIAYDYEEKLILEYGRKGIDENGTLMNVCLGSNPPSLKGKTYAEFYGEEKAKIIIENKRQLQILAGGYGPKKFSDETKKKLSEQRKGQLNPRYGVKIAGTDVAKKIGDAKRGKKVYKKSKLFAIHDYNENKITYIYMNDLQKYCIKNNYSCGTFHAQLELNRGLPKYGKNVGLLIREATELEKEKYSECTKVSEIKLDYNGEENE